jgi:y4mF family transcriptional regulator
MSMFLIGNIAMRVWTIEDLGSFAKSVRKALGLTQDQLALTSGTNRRFVIELEAGKPTAQTGKVLQVLRTLGISVDLTPPPGIDLAAPPPAPKNKPGRKRRRGPAA